MGAPLTRVRVPGRRFKPALEVAEGVSLGQLNETRPGTFNLATMFGTSAPDSRPAAEKADIYIVINATCVELTNVLRYSEEVVKGGCDAGAGGGRGAARLVCALSEVSQQPSTSLGEVAPTTARPRRVCKVQTVACKVHKSWPAGSCVGAGGALSVCPAQTAATRHGTRTSGGMAMLDSRWVCTAA
jgi:hypothetical protein